MAQKANPDLARDLARFGASDLMACFNCGNCTAVCPLSEGDTVFPRKLVRYAQLGLKDRLVAMSEPWLCYYCGECSATCPREAGPGETMAALRRYSIASADPSGLSGLMYRRPTFAVLVTVVLAVVLGLFLMSLHPKHEFSAWIFHWIPYDVIHTVGMVLSGVIGLFMLAGVANILRRYSADMGGVGALFRSPGAMLGAARKTVSEIVTMRRHGRCQENETSNAPWYLMPRWVHWSIMWGFLGLFGATLLDFLFIFFLSWTAFPPARVLGTVSGLVMLYGVSVSLYQRGQGKATHLKHSVLADWWLLGFLFVLAVTGFWLELAVTFHWQGVANEAALLVHTVMAMELILLVTLTKLAHALYRPLALWIHFLRQEMPATDLHSVPSSPTDV